ncbi:hypothetical protein BH24ACT6_BH24ACT6_19340 [soil metagenome]
MRRVGALGATMLLGTGLFVGLPARPATAEVIRGSDVGEYGFSYDDCGFTVDVEGLFSSPRSMARVGRGADTSVFFGHDNYTITETHTRRGSAATLTITVHGLLRDVQATPVSRSVFQFTMMDVAHAEATDEIDAVLGRENGQIRRVVLFDTLGDETPGGMLARGSRRGAPRQIRWRRHLWIVERRLIEVHVVHVASRVDLPDARISAFLDGLTTDDLVRTDEVVENGSSPVSECVYTVFEEEFHHNRYTLRDLALLE